jgi:DNA repair protein RecO (recombination protein O)
MHFIKTKGIVIRGTNFGEADKILTVLTERFGKVKVMAKGIRKIKSHMAGALEPFIISDLMLYEGKTFYLVTGASIVYDFPKLHVDLLKTSTAFYVGELIDRFLEEHQQAPEIFSLFVEVLDSIESEEKSLLVSAFELKIVEHSGYKPELYECVHCQEKIREEKNYWDGIEGGLICEKCQREHKHGREIYNNTIKLFRFIQKNPIEEIRRIQAKSDISIEASDILERYIANILERELKSKKFLKSL